MSQRMQNSTAATATVQVFCRIRPTSALEYGKNTCVQCMGENIEVTTKTGNFSFTLDKIFNIESTQSQVFQEVGGTLITDVLSGYNATIMAYGQSGSGKVPHNPALSLYVYYIT